MNLLVAVRKSFWRAVVNLCVLARLAGLLVGLQLFSSYMPVSSQIFFSRAELTEFS